MNTDTSPHYPSSYDCKNIVSVAATDSTDDLASFSNYGADSPSGAYLNGANHYAQIQFSGFSPYRGTKLEYAFSGISEPNYDFLHVESSHNGTSWSDHYQFSGSTGGGWTRSYPADLKAHEGSSQLYVRYQFSSDASQAYDGWYIDDASVTAWSPDPADAGYRYLSGTSMATPHVAGLAALLKAFDQSLSHLQIKQAILSNVDAVPALEGKVSSGGRINAYKSLSNPRPGCPACPAFQLLLLRD